MEPAVWAPAVALFNAVGNFNVDTGEVLAPSIVNVNNSVVALNRAQGGTGDPGGDGLGGGAYNDASSTLTFKRTTVTGNRADGAATDGEGIGGGVYNLGTFTFDTLTVIRNNKASTNHDNIFG